MTLALLPFLILGDEVAGLLLSFTSLDTLTLFFTLLSSEVPADPALVLLVVDCYSIVGRERERFFSFIKSFLSGLAHVYYIDKI